MKFKPKHVVWWRPFMCLLPFAGFAAALAQQPADAPQRIPRKNVSGLAHSLPESSQLPFNRQDNAAAKRTTEPYSEVPKVVLRDRDDRVTLIVAYAENTFGVERLRHRSYNGSLVGPTIRVQPGARLRVRLENRLPNSVGLPFVGHDKPHGFNVTNLHTHGLHVSPVGRHDNVFLEVLPGECFDYVFDIPEDHPPGTFWYHPHKHGSVGLQVASGMAGALIVEGGLDDAPELANVDEKVLVIQQFVYRRSEDGGPSYIDADDVYGQGDPIIITSINGQVIPTIRMRPGEIQRWRLVHAGIRDTVDLNLEQHLLHEIAFDGLALGTVKTRDVVSLQPGNRSDLLVQAGTNPGEYMLYSQALNAQKSLRDQPMIRIPLAKVQIEGEPMAMELPQPESLAKYKPYESIDADEVTNEREIIFNGEGGYTIDGKPFDLQDTSLKVPVGAVEEWVVRSIGGKHPFHIHVNPFEILATNPDTREVERTWADTVLIPDHGSVRFRTRFEDLTGHTVIHCHILDHEDLGMMRVLHIYDPRSESSPVAVSAARVGPGPTHGSATDAESILTNRQVIAPPRPGPKWVLRNADGRNIRSESTSRGATLLSLHLGLGCSHCARQIIMLAKREQEFRRLGVSIVAIGPEIPDQASVREFQRRFHLAFPLLGDPELNVYRQLNCLGEGNSPRHGTFFIDKSGNARWQSIGDEPETDMDLLMRIAKEYAG